MYIWTESAIHQIQIVKKMMTDLKSIELSSFTFDILLNYCFLVVFMLMTSQSQSEYDLVSTCGCVHYKYVCIQHRSRSAWYIHVL